MSNGPRASIWRPAVKLLSAIAIEDRRALCAFRDVWVVVTELSWRLNIIVTSNVWSSFQSISISLRGVNAWRQNVVGFWFYRLLLKFR